MLLFQLRFWIPGCDIFGACNGETQSQEKKLKQTVGKYGHDAMFLSFVGEVLNGNC